MHPASLTSPGALLPPDPGIYLRCSSGWQSLRESGQGLSWEMASLIKQDVQEERVPLVGQILSHLEGTQELWLPPSARVSSQLEHADGEQNPGTLRGPWCLSPSVTGPHLWLARALLLVACTCDFLRGLPWAPEVPCL